MLDPDWRTRGALAAWLGEGEEERVVALASYARIGESDTAEIAFAVADDEQGRGIGTRLVEQLAGRALGQGISRFVAGVLASNAKALGVFADAGFEISRDGDRDEIELLFPIRPTPAYEARVERRDHTAVVASLRSFFEPRHGGRDRRLAPARIDRRGALPQHPRGGLRRSGLPGQPQGRAGRRREGLPSIDEIEARSISPSSAFPPNSADALVRLAPRGEQVPEPLHLLDVVEEVFAKDVRKAIGREKRCQHQEDEPALGAPTARSVKESAGSIA